MDDETIVAAATQAYSDATETPLFETQLLEPSLEAGDVLEASFVECAGDTVRAGTVEYEKRALEARLRRAGGREAAIKTLRELFPFFNGIAEGEFSQYESTNDSTEMPPAWVVTKVVQSRSQKFFKCVLCFPRPVAVVNVTLDPCFAIHVQPDADVELCGTHWTARTRMPRVVTRLDLGWCTAGDLLHAEKRDLSDDLTDVVSRAETDEASNGARVVASELRSGIADTQLVDETDAVKGIELSDQPEDELVDAVSERSVLSAQLGGAASRLSDEEVSAADAVLKKKKKKRRSSRDKSDDDAGSRRSSRLDDEASAEAERNPSNLRRRRQLVDDGDDEDEEMESSKQYEVSDEVVSELARCGRALREAADSVERVLEAVVVRRNGPKKKRPGVRSIIEEEEAEPTWLEEESASKKKRKKKENSSPSLEEIEDSWSKCRKSGWRDVWDYNLFGKETCERIRASQGSLKNLYCYIKPRVKKETAVPGYNCFFSKEEVFAHLKSKKPELSRDDIIREADAFGLHDLSRDVRRMALSEARRRLARETWEQRILEKTRDLCNAKRPKRAASPFKRRF